MALKEIIRFLVSKLVTTMCITTIFHYILDHSIFCVAPPLNAYKMHLSENEANVSVLLFLQV